MEKKGERIKRCLEDGVKVYFFFAVFFAAFLAGFFATFFAAFLGFAPQAHPQPQFILFTPLQ